MIINLNGLDFAHVFGEITPRVSKKILAAGLAYETLTPEMRDSCIRDIVEGLMRSKFEQVGVHRKEKWEEGWSKNLAALKDGKEAALVPYYFRNDEVARWRREFVKPTKPGFDRGGLSIILEWLFEKYMIAAPAVYEFGCGTGHHLIQLRTINPTAKLFGLDWTNASQQILAAMPVRGILDNVEGHNFDFFQPNYDLHLEKDAVIYTVGALEQVGNHHHAFVNYLRAEKPALCVHVEPIEEVLDPKNLLDYLALEYFASRNYLSGFLTNLRNLERQNQVTIHDVRRTFLGGNMYVDHYTVVVWSPR